MPLLRFSLLSIRRDTVKAGAEGLLKRPQLACDLHQGVDRADNPRQPWRPGARGPLMGARHVSGSLEHVMDEDRYRALGFDPVEPPSSRAPEAEPVKPGKDPSTTVLRRRASRR